MTLPMLPYLLALLLLVVGLYAIVAKRNVIKIIVGLAILDYAVNLILVLVGYRTTPGAAPMAPILTAAWPTSRPWWPGRWTRFPRRLS